MTSAVARCCHNAAAMLRIADRGVIDTKEGRARILAANEGQAKLLIQAAEIADEMLIEAEQSAMTFEAIAKALGELGPETLAGLGLTDMMHECIMRAKANRAVIAKAGSAS